MFHHYVEQLYSRIQRVMATKDIQRTMQITIYSTETTSLRIFNSLDNTLTGSHKINVRY